MPDSLSRMEDASLYVLELLEPDAKRAFESELAASPDLQQQVADLRTNLEALALAAPPSTPPARVWHAIAERTAREPQPAAEPTLTFWTLVRSWFTNGWAVATALAAVFVVHLLLEPPVRIAALSGESSRQSRDPRGIQPDRNNRPGSVSGAASQGRPNASAARLPTASNSVAADPRLASETSRLQDRVRTLSDQVALLTRVLGQQSFLPAGSSRLQVFRLVSTNGNAEILETPTNEPRRLASNTPDTGSPSVSEPPGPSTPVASSTPDVSLTLALAAARQLATLATAPGLSGFTGGDLSAENTTSFPPPTTSRTPIDSSLALDGANPGAKNAAVAPTETPAVRDPIQIVDLAQNGSSFPGATGAIPDSGIVSTSDGSAFGAFSPDTGQGAIAFRVPGESVDSAGVYQLWMTDSATGSVQSLGITTSAGAGAAPQVFVLRFAVDGTAVTAPTFMITREPVGGSTTPTGPVVAQPPPMTGISPNP